jgi:hypothetical protein
LNWGIRILHEEPEWCFLDLLSTKCVKEIMECSNQNQICMTIFRRLKPTAKDIAPMQQPVFQCLIPCRSLQRTELKDRSLILQSVVQCLIFCRSLQRTELKNRSLIL